MILPSRPALFRIAEPPPCSQQPPTLLPSTVERDSLLSGFAEAWPSGGCG